MDFSSITKVRRDSREETPPEKVEPKVAKLLLNKNKVNVMCDDVKGLKPMTMAKSRWIRAISRIMDMNDPGKDFRVTVVIARCKKLDTVAEKVSTSGRLGGYACDVRKHALTQVPQQLLTNVRFRNLRHLNLWGNEISELPHNMNELWPRLEVLDVSNNNLSDVPVSISRMTCTQLYFNSNRFKHWPEAINHCVTLQVLHFGANEISQIPNSVCNLVELHQLVICHNKLDDIPQNVLQCPKLNDVMIGKNPFRNLKKGVLNLLDQHGTAAFVEWRSLIQHLEDEKTKKKHMKYQIDKALLLKPESEVVVEIYEEGGLPALNMYLDQKYPIYAEVVKEREKEMFDPDASGSDEEGEGVKDTDNNLEWRKRRGGILDENSPLNAIEPKRVTKQSTMDRSSNMVKSSSKKGSLVRRASQGQIKTGAEVVEDDRVASKKKTRSKLPPLPDDHSTQMKVKSSIVSQTQFEEGVVGFMPDEFKDPRNKKKFLASKEAGVKYGVNAGKVLPEEQKNDLKRLPSAFKRKDRIKEYAQAPDKTPWYETEDFKAYKHKLKFPSAHLVKDMPIEMSAMRNEYQSRNVRTAHKAVREKHDFLTALHEYKRLKVEEAREAKEFANRGRSRESIRSILDSAQSNSFGLWDRDTYSTATRAKTSDASPVSRSGPVGYRRTDRSISFINMPKPLAEADSTALNKKRRRASSMVGRARTGSIAGAVMQFMSRPSTSTEILFQATNLLVKGKGKEVAAASPTTPGAVAKIAAWRGKLSDMRRKTKVAIKGFEHLDI